MFAVYYSTTLNCQKDFSNCVQLKINKGVSIFVFCISNCGIVFLYMNIFEFHEHRNSLNTYNT